MESSVRQSAAALSSLPTLLFDLTLPIVSIFTGHSLNSMLKNIFQDIQIEDLWIPYFCVVCFSTHIICEMYIIFTRPT